MKVRRVLVAEYEAPLSHYNGMSREEVEAFEKQDWDVGLVLDNLVAETVEVTFQ